MDRGMITFLKFVLIAILDFTHQYFRKVIVNFCNNKLIDPETCKLCFTGGLCRGGSNVAILEGYWRENLESDITIKCDVRKLCVGGYE